MAPHADWLQLPGGPGEGEAPPWPRPGLIFAGFTLIVQSLMSFDGGATQLSTHNLRQYGGWSASELGLLMAMDRVGVVLTGSLWSAAFTRLEAKPLLVVGLLAKAASCFLFGVLNVKWSMLAAKFFMGVWEGLFAIWATTWVGQTAPHNAKEVWQNYLGIFAAVGNGAGGLVAGLLSRHYALAFVGQAIMLGVVWLGLLVLPAKCFELEGGLTRVKSTESGTPLSQKSSGTPLGGAANDRTESHVYPPNELPRYWRARRRVQTQVEHVRSGLHWFGSDVAALVCGNPLWLHTAMCFSLCFFVTTGASSLWQNTVVNVWGFTDWQATLSFQVTTVMGGLPGVLLGPRWINAQLDPSLGLDDPRKRRRCLALCLYATVAAALCSTLGMVGLALKIGFLVHANIPDPAWGGILGCLLVSLAMLYFFLNAVQGFFIEINRTSVPKERRSFAIGLTLNCQNLFGFGMGPFLPGLVTNAFGSWLRYAWPMESPSVVEGAMFTFGMCFVLTMSWTLVLFTWCAFRASRGYAGASSDALGS